MKGNANEKVNISESAPKQNEIGYTVFYSDSEEIAKALAVSHIQNNATKNQFVVERPYIGPKQIVSGIIFPLFIILACVLFCLFYHWYPWWAFVLTLFFIIVLFIKRFVILLVLLYQKTAPERVRCSCVFEPTCSNYMLLAIDKYGFWIGFFKGVKRLFKCHPPNGGIDNP